VLPTAGSTIDPTLEFVELQGGTFLMGTEDRDGFPEDHEGPVRPAAVRPFAISRHAVSNDQFARFIAATSYVTDAERFGWSFVFARFVPGALRKISPRSPAAPWWCAVPGATWAAPEGPGSSASDRGDHPVVHVSWNDAHAYCAWAGGRLPAEAEWEYAARGGLEQARYPWGNELDPGGRYMCNIWRGTFPVRATGEDGYVGTAPVTAFDPNGFGLYNMCGNVWEWCADPWEPGGESPRVMRGGSYLCHASYCNRYRVGARSKSDPDSGSGNNGLRVARDIADAG
jgi:formylglycine-generating enzyme required for sulfatase activity